MVERSWRNSQAISLAFASVMFFTVSFSSCTVSMGRAAQVFLAFPSRFYCDKTSCHVHAVSMPFGVQIFQLSMNYD
jgi:hypothetical protein